MNTTKVILLSLAIFLQSCQEKSAHNDVNSTQKMLANSVPTEFYEEINGAFRDVLISNGFPIGNIMSIELLVKADQSSDQDTNFLMRSIIPESEMKSYRPIIFWGDEEVLPKSVESVTSYEYMTEVEVLYVARNSIFSGKEDIKIKAKQDGNFNVILSAIEKKYVDDKLKEMASRDGIIYIPINL